MAGIESKRASMVPVILIIALFAAVAVMSTVIVSVIERTREFGVIASLGLNQGQIARMVALEATYTTVLGFLVGVVAGFGFTFLMTATNLIGPFIRTFYGSLLSGLALGDQFVLAASLSYVAWAAVTIVLAAILAIAVPRRRVRTLNPAEAMRAA